MITEMPLEIWKNHVGQTPFISIDIAYTIRFWVWRRNIFNQDQNGKLYHEERKESTKAKGQRKGSKITIY